MSMEPSFVDKCLGREPVERAVAARYSIAVTPSGGRASDITVRHAAIAASGSPITKYLSSRRAARWLRDVPDI